MHLEVEPQVRWAKLLNALSSVVLSGGWPGDIAPQAQGERHHEQSGGKSRQRWSEQPFLTLSDRNVRSSLYISHIGRL